MKTVKISQIQRDPNLMLRNAADGSPVMVLKRGDPVGFFVDVDTYYERFNNAAYTPYRDRRDFEDGNNQIKTKTEAEKKDGIEKFFDKYEDSISAQKILLEKKLDDLIDKRGKMQKGDAMIQEKKKHKEDDFISSLRGSVPGPKMTPNQLVEFMRETYDEYMSQ